MSYNGSGVYTLPGAALVNGAVVSATENNQFRNDVAAALNVAWTRDGQAPATANIPMSNHKLTGLSAGTANGDSVRYEQVTSAVGITGGSISGVTISTPNQLTSTLSTGTAPFSVTSTTKVANLNVDKLDDADWASPAAIGSSTPNTGVFTLLTSTAYIETKTSIAASNIDLSVGNYFSKTISGTTTFTVSNTPTSGKAASFILDLTNGGSATINWWSGMKWAGGTAPTLTTSGRDVLGFFTYDGGTTWTGLVLGKDVK